MLHPVGVLQEPSLQADYRMQRQATHSRIPFSIVLSLGFRGLLSSVPLFTTSTSSYSFLYRLSGAPCVLFLFATRREIPEKLKVAFFFFYTSSS